MTTLEVTAWSPEPGLLSEGPRWHEERQELLWVLSVTGLGARGPGAAPYRGRVPFAGTTI